MYSTIYRKSEQNEVYTAYETLFSFQQPKLSDKQLLGCEVKYKYVVDYSIHSLLIRVPEAEPRELHKIHPLVLQTMSEPYLHRRERQHLLVYQCWR